MAKTSLEEWLAGKRRQGNRTAMADMSGAPSVAERYGFSKPTNGANRGVLPSGAGFSTGYGADGKLQRHMPTDIRQAPGGGRYAVDEGEVVVVNADTVARYGGAQALDRFIASNAPGGQQAQPQAMGGVQQPQAQGFRSPAMPFAQAPQQQPQARVAEQVMQQRIPQMARGGAVDWTHSQFGPGGGVSLPGSGSTRTGAYYTPGAPTAKASGSVTVTPDKPPKKGISAAERAANEANAAGNVSLYGGAQAPVVEPPTRVATPGHGTSAS